MKKKMLFIITVFAMCLCACTSTGNAEEAGQPVNGNETAAATALNSQPAGSTVALVSPTEKQENAAEKNIAEADDGQKQGEAAAISENENAAEPAPTERLPEDITTDDDTTANQGETAPDDGIETQGETASDDDAANQGEAAPDDDAKPDINSILDAYVSYIHACSEDEEFTDTMRVALGFVDEDDIPELFVAMDRYHACGVKVCSFIDGEVKELGEFGEFGEFSYIDRLNWIYSFYMGMGVEQLSKWSISDGGAVCDMDIVYDENEHKYYVGDNEAEEDAYQAVFEAIHEPARYGENETVYVNYEEMLSYYPNFSFGYSDKVIRQMYDAILEGRILSSYVASQMLDMVGDWSPEYFTYFSYADNESYEYYEEDQENSDIYVESELTIEEETADYQISIYNKDYEDMASFLDSDARQIYTPLGIAEGIDYGWNTELEGTADADVFLTMPDEEHVILVGFVTNEEVAEEESGSTFYGVYRRTGTDNQEE